MEDVLSWLRKLGDDHALVVVANPDPEAGIVQDLNQDRGKICYVHTISDVLSFCAFKLYNANYLL